ncbi:uncharacterized protein F5147DRAFT_818452 [Suillus discolor]|uniref:Protein kinase domain-containing protein n=1 Tax=Suillus discolor TaxID=1912936 RepID=A0A9P7EXC8_9AGAM|nr:uncharacterized protein F5147DRAFT_818452 [Suillus discolor]KAG2096328.1 hypothetical protein F5147DRAFT_818452 [Suillus discolor]
MGERPTGDRDIELDAPGCRFSVTFGNVTSLLAYYAFLTTCSDLTWISHFGSSVRWAAPELFEVLDVEDASSSPKLESDIYSFGCIAYQVLSGKLPYYNICSDNQVVVAILKGVKPEHPDIAVIEDYQWNFTELSYHSDLPLRMSQI